MNNDFINPLEKFCFYVNSDKLALSIQNSMFGSKLFINDDSIPEIEHFKKRFKYLESTFFSIIFYHY